MSMRRIACLFIIAAAFTAAADPPREEIVEANSLLQQGKTKDALRAYRNLQIDDPESDLLYYNIGCAQLESAAEPGIPEDSVAAIESLNAAKTSFDKASMANLPNIRRDARFNRINCDSRLAKHLVATGDFEGTIGAFEDAIYGYEDFLEQYPGHPGAQKNMNQMRYLLKKMLQDPPPEQDQQEQESGEGEKNQDGDQQEQQQQEQESGEDGENQDADQQEQQQGEGEEKPEGQPGEQESPGEDEQPQPDQEDSSGDGQSDANSQPGEEQQSGDDQSNADAAQGEEPAELPSRDTIEAILDALQERDNEEQLNMRRVPQNPRRSGPWW